MMARAEKPSSGASGAPVGYWVGIVFLFTCLLVSLVLATPALGQGSTPGPRTLPDEPSTLLADGWQLRSSAGLEGGGAAVSRAGYDVAGWTAAKIPTTVLAALVASGEIPDPYTGKNLEAIPAVRFAVPWWYRTEFAVAAPLPAESRLVLHGINYSAEVWLNGELIAGRDQVRGSFRTFELDVTGKLRDGVNALALLVHPPVGGDFTIGFVDWNPPPPDRNMGVWREVELRRTRGVSLDDVFVRSELDLPTLANARLTLGGRVTNHTAGAQQVTLRGKLGDVPFEHKLSLAPREARDVALTPAEVPQLLVRSPRVWWPNNLGEPNLYHLDLEAVAGGAVSDRHGLDFGIRQVADYVDEHGRGYIVNGKKVLVRGGGWVDDLLLADSHQRLEDQIRYVKHLNLNTIRLEGFWGTTHELYDLADRYGIMVWVGWSCQWEWENYLGAPVDETFGGADTEADMELLSTSMRDQVVRFRNHPSVVVWNLASDMLAKPELERRYRAMLSQVDPTRPPLAACSVRTSEVSGPTAVKMNGPYEWVPPNYWYVDTKNGGAFGFNTETGPGAQPPPIGSIMRMLPKEHWWPIDDMWSYHCGRGEFKDLGFYTKALEGRYGKATGLGDFAKKAQVANYEAMRAMFESFSLRRPAAKGVVQWMLNSAWPDMFWQLYDWYLVPNGAYFATRNANKPLHVAYDYGERKVVAVNDTGAALTGATAQVRVYDAASRMLFEASKPVAVPAGERRDVVTLDPFAQLEKRRQASASGAPAAPPVYFLDTRILGADGAVLARNFYWLAAQDDVLDYEKHQWFVTPVSRYADLSPVSSLPEAVVDVSHRFERTDDGEMVIVSLENKSDKIAFFVELSLVGGKSGVLAAPIYWDDNYVSLLPGERREIRGTIPRHALAGEHPQLRWQGMNLPSTAERRASVGGSPSSTQSSIEGGH